MARQRDFNRTPYSDLSRTEPVENTESPKKETRIQWRGTPVRVRTGPGTNFPQVDKEYIVDGDYYIDEVVNGPGSKTGWGHLSDGKGWVALDYVRLMK